MRIRSLVRLLMCLYTSVCTPSHSLLSSHRTPSRTEPQSLRLKASRTSVCMAHDCGVVSPVPPQGRHQAFHRRTPCIGLRPVRDCERALASVILLPFHELSKLVLSPARHPHVCAHIPCPCCRPRYTYSRGSMCIHFGILSNVHVVVVVH